MYDFNWIRQYYVQFRDWLWSFEIRKLSTQFFGELVGMTSAQTEEEALDPDWKPPPLRG